jgi:FkbM family methyltransferase
MVFISYAQNQEDVILDRAFKNLDTGFYIDVGACDPVIDSVTKSFYERGWHGINIEPVDYYYRLLKQQRPKDTNIGVLVSNQNGEQLFHEITETGLSSVHENYTKYQETLGRKVLKRLYPCRTLDSICIENKVEVVHFLKVDVEGAEKEVFEGFSFSHVRPWIIVAEIHEPDGTDVSKNWEYILFNHNYIYVYFDGINRFYLAQEHIDLKSAFSAPPNITDNYINWKDYSLGQAASQKEIIDLKKQLSSVDNVYKEIYQSFSWRLTAPIRKLGNIYTRLKKR